MSPSAVLDAWLRDHLFDAVPAAIAVIDPSWKIVRANRVFEERFGEWRDRRCYEAYKDRDSRCAHCPARTSFTDGQVRSRHEVGCDKSGRTTHYLLQIAPVTREDGTIPFLVEMSTDITRQRELREELAAANVLNRTLIEASGDAIVALGRGDEVARWNPAARRLFGWTDEDVVGLPPPEGLLPNGFTTAVRAGQDFALPETTARRKDGSPVAVRFYGTPLTSNAGALGSAAFFQDLSEIKQLEREKLDSERLAAVGQTVAGLAHGIKNILTGLEGGLYLMKTGLDRASDERVREGFAMLSRNIGRVSSFVRTLLDFSRGHTPLVALHEPVALVEEVAALFRDAARGSGVALDVERAGPVSPAAFDSEGLHTCLANLVANAIDACRMSERPERRVIMRVREEPDPAARRGAGPPPSAVVFEVEDDGIGMEYEVKRKVFTNFFTTKGEGGTGLGLLLTRKITHEHGGAIEVDSEPGRGTVFRLKFPRRRLPPLSPAPAARSEHAPTP